MTLAGSSTLAAASAYFNGQLLGSPFDAPSGFIGRQLCTDVSEQAKSARFQLTLATPQLRQWVGSKQLKSLRAFESTIDVVKWEKSFSLDRFDVVNDRTGSVIAAIDRFIAQIPDDLETRIISALFGNAVNGYDGVPFFSNAHPFTNSTGNNITTASLSFETYRAAVQAMRLFADEDGRPWNISPTHLVVGPALERTAKEIVGADRPVPFSATTQDATSGIVGATVIPNVFQGEVQVMVTNKLSGGQWGVFDLSKGVAPVIRPVAEELHPVMLDREDQTYVFFNDEYAASVQGYMGFGPGPWQLGYGRVQA